MKLKLLLSVVLLLLAACSPASPFDFDISGALDFDLKAVSANRDSTNTFATLNLYNDNPDSDRPTAGGYVNIYGLDAVGVGDYEVRNEPGGCDEPNIVVSIFRFQSLEGSFKQNTSGRSA